MSCYHPLIREVDLNRGTTRIFSTTQYDYYKKEIKITNHLSNYKTNFIPCGKCIGCRLDYSRQWATRCSLEALSYKSNYFLTLTYNNENLPMQEQTVDEETGVIYERNESWAGDLQPEHLTKFIKALRQHYKREYNHEGIRFFACGEYGEKGHRPHYHAIIFNLPINDLEYLARNETYNALYTSKTIEKIWGKGQVIIGNVSWSSAAYVARYVMKKAGGIAKSNYAELGQTNKEFIRMSRMPGIGRTYYEEHRQENGVPDFYINDEIIMKTVKGNTGNMKPPKYFDKILKEENKKEYTKIKNRRMKEAKKAEKIKDSKTTLSQKEQYELEERQKILKIGQLKRSLEE